MFQTGTNINQCYAKKQYRETVAVYGRWVATPNTSRYRIFKRPFSSKGKVRLNLRGVNHAPAVVPSEIEERLRWQVGAPRRQEAGGAAQTLPPNGDGAGLTLLIGEGVSTGLSAKEATGFV